eukprot:6178898-Amphidinium_carterae.1
MWRLLACLLVGIGHHPIPRAKRSPYPINVSDVGNESSARGGKPFNPAFPVGLKPARWGGRRRWVAARVAQGNSP